MDFMVFDWLIKLNQGFYMNLVTIMDVYVTRACVGVEGGRGLVGVGCPNFGGSVLGWKIWLLPEKNDPPPPLLGFIANETCQTMRGSRTDHWRCARRGREEYGSSRDEGRGLGLPNCVAHCGNLRNHFVTFKRN